MAKRILLIEDDEPIAELMRMVLGDEGYVVEWAPTTDDGIQQVRDIPPDLVLLDFTMLGSRGLEYFQRCKQDPSLSDLAIVVMSGASVATMTWSDGFMPDAVLAKPFDLDELCGVVDRLVGDGVALADGAST